MNKDSAVRIYGEGYLTNAYSEIDRLINLNRQAEELAIPFGIPYCQIPDELEEESLDIEERRYELIETIEQNLILASSEVYFTSPDRRQYDSPSVFLGYSAYIAALNSKITEKAKLMAKAATLLRKGVPIITEASNRPNPGAVLANPQFVIRQTIGDTVSYFKSDEIEPDDSQLTFSATMKVARINTEEDYIFGPDQLSEMIIGSNEISAYVDYVCGSELFGPRERLISLQNQLQTLHVPKLANDDLVGLIEYTGSSS